VLASLALSLAALQPARAEENFYEAWPYVVPSDVLPFVRDKAQEGDAEATLAALEEFAVHYPSYTLGRCVT
jgi:hypothetical protein